jgi:hypothetical protein
MTEEIGMHFGALCDSIDKQLNAQGYSVSAKDSERLQKIANAITMLKMHDIIPDSVVHKAHQKLMHLIANAESLAETDP